MSRTSQSLGQASISLLGTVTTTANSFSTAVDTVGKSFEVLNIKASDWVTDTRIKSAALAEEREDAIIDEITFSIANRAVERDKILESNPLLRAAYDKVYARVQARVQTAAQRQAAASTVPNTP